MCVSVRVWLCACMCVCVSDVSGYVYSVFMCEKREILGTEFYISKYPLCIYIPITKKTVYTIGTLGTLYQVEQQQV